MEKIHRRSFKVDFTLIDDTAPYFEGCFIRYNSPANYLNSEWREQIAPGAVSLNDDMVCLYNHNPDFILGRQSAGTFELDDRDDGLYGRCLLNMDDSDAKNVYARVKRGDISGCSFGFFIDDQEVDRANQLVTLTRLRAREVSITPFPFYGSTSMEARCEAVVKEKNLQELRLKFLKRRLEKYGTKSNVIKKRSRD